MLILGIESSCDETAIAVVKNGKQVLSSQIASQTMLHEKWGGVIPEIAAREHLSALKVIYEEALRESSTDVTSIDAIAVTQGPGLVGCLLVGVTFAKGLAMALRKPLIPVNHVHAHVHGALLGVAQATEDVFPTLALVVSGGHTNLYYLNSPLEFELLAHTMDDACGESFDKVGKMLGLPYPGGPLVETLARKGLASKVDLPTMMERKSQMAFSYSGLKTAVSLAVKHPKGNVQPEDIAAAFQEEALGQLIRKLTEAVRLRPTAKSILIAGGVAANQRFRELMTLKIKLPALFPPLQYCSDNGAMIAAMGYYEATAKPPSTELNWDVFSRYPFERYKATNHP
ncbi:MAG: tRNA (adenosine(37)-N6)-threonylcarbamoyltransferase complex transferase subunit TsaD [Proteobacteria bacterium]|nr:tRNA (adenosine(37)-N6)-threonylcarbamoyltransferase complex transferase subunit TsaD [Pseudomonadota bacterium]